MSNPDKLAHDLAGATQLSLDWIRAVLTAGLDEGNSALLRAQSAAAGIAINAQLRADQLKMRSAREDKALERLVKLIQDKALTVPSVVANDSQHRNIG